MTQASKRRVEILGKETRYEFDKIRFRVEAATLRYELLNGKMSDPLVRLNLDRGDGSAAILYDSSADTVVMIEQFRYATYEQGQGWIVELPAGIINPAENPADTMQRELMEETGYQIAHLEHVYTFYVSPGGSSERIFLYFGEVNPAHRITPGGGLVTEHEDIRVLVMPLTEVWRKIETGEICDAKTIIGLQWLQLRRLANGQKR